MSMEKDRSFLDAVITRPETTAAEKPKKKMSAAQIRANDKYNKKAYFSFLVRFPKSEEQAIRQAAGESLNRFIIDAVREKMQRETEAETES